MSREVTILESLKRAEIGQFLSALKEQRGTNFLEFEKTKSGDNTS